MSTKRAAILAAYVAIAVVDAALGQMAPPAAKVLDSPSAPIVISHGRGGLVSEHELKFFTYWHSRNKVELRGPCYSACTLVTAFIGKDKLCIAEGAFLAFHAVRSAERGEIMLAATERLYWLQPIDIRRWIDRAGGYASLPINGYWTMYDRELWAMGYPRCAP